MNGAIFIANDAVLSKPRPGFESPWGHNKKASQKTGFFVVPYAKLRNRFGQTDYIFFGDCR
jgi:hypothetical protein